MQPFMRLHAHDIITIQQSLLPYSWIETTKTNGLEPCACLRYLFTALLHPMTVDVLRRSYCELKREGRQEQMV